MLKFLKGWRKPIFIFLIAILVTSNFSSMVSAEEKENQGISVSTDLPTKESTYSVQSEAKSGQLLKGTEPLANITFSVQSTGGNQAWYDLKTNSNGLFTYNLPDGDYRLKGVWVDPKWYQMDRVITIRNGLVNGTDEWVIDVLAMEPPAPTAKNVSGTLLNGQNLLTNITFSIHSTDGKSWYDAKSDAEGKFAFQLPDGSYQLDGIWLPTENKWMVLNLAFSVLNGQLQGATTLDINLASSHNVTGFLKKGSAILPNVVFSISSTSGEVKWYDTESDSNGHFGFNLPNGTYRLEGVWVPAEGEWYDLQKEFTVSGSLQLDIDVLNQVPNVTGVLKKGMTVLPNVTFSVTSTLGEPVWYDTVTDESGQFKLSLPKGNYKLIGIWLNDENKWYELQKEFSVNGKFNFEIDLDAITSPAFNVEGQLKNGDKAIADTWFSVHTTSGEEKWYDAKTDANGHFVFVLPNGTYELDGVWVDAEKTWYPLQKVFTIDGSANLNIDLSAPPEAEPNITGNVVYGIQVIADTVFSLHTTSGEVKWYDVKTDLKGNFALNLPDGNYQIDGVWVEKEKTWFVLNYSFTISNGKLVGSDQLAIDLAKRPSTNTTVTGVVKDNKGPISGLKVAIYELETNNQYFATTDGTGYFKLDLPNGPYEVRQLSNDAFSATVSKAFRTQDGKIYVGLDRVNNVELSLPPITVSGKLTNEGTALNEAKIVVQKNTKDYFVASTNAAGEFSLRLEDGHYRLGKIYYSGTEVDASTIQFDVVNGQASPLAIEMTDLLAPVNGNVNGVVKDLKGPVADAEVFIESGDEWYVAITDSRGHFSLELPDGVYVVNHVKPKDFGYIWFDQHFTVQNNELIVDEVATDQLVLTIPSVAVVGTVNLTSANTYMTIVSDDGSPSKYYTTPSDNGQFALRLQDGSYRIQAVKADGFYYQVDIAFSIVNGQLKVDNVEKEKLTVTIPDTNVKAQFLMGGKAASGTSVIFADSNGKRASFITDRDGKLNGYLRDGSYRFENIGVELETVHLDVSFEIKNGKMVENGVETDLLSIPVPGAFFKATVTDEAGKAVPNTYVLINELNLHFGYGFYTDEFGQISFLLPNGDYQITNLDGQSYDSKFTIKDGQLLVNNEVKDSLTLMLNPITASGVVKDSEGKLIRSGELSIAKEGANGSREYSHARVDEKGEFHLRISDGNYELLWVATDGGNIDLDLPFQLQNGVLLVDGVEQTSLAVTIPAVSVVGSIFNTLGKPLYDSGYLSVIEENTQYYYSTNIQNGQFKFRLGDGDYRINTLSYKGIEMQLDVKFSVRNGKLDGKERLDLLLPEANVKGQLLDENNQPVAYGQISITPKSTGDIYILSSRTDQNGLFQFSLLDGEYEVSEAVINDSNQTMAIPFEVNDGKLIVGGVEKESLTIKLLPVTVKGKLVDGSDKPISYGSVNVSSVADGTNYHTFADKNGQFEMRLPDGNYVLNSVFNPTNSDYWSNLKINFSVVNHQLVVGGVNQDTLTVTLGKVYSIHVNVSEAGQPAVNATVIWSRQDSLLNKLGLKTDLNGNVTLKLENGEYVIRTIDPEIGSDIPMNLSFKVVDGKLFVNNTEQEKLELSIPKLVLFGQVTDGAGPVVSAVISLNKLVNGTVNSTDYTVTNEKGEYGFRLPDGDYSINTIYVGTQNFVKNTILKIENGKLYVDGVLKERLDLSIPAQSFKGTLFEDGKPLTSAYFYLNKKGTNDLFYSFYKTIQVSSDGSFSYRLEDGDYQISSAVRLPSYSSFPLNTVFSIKNGKLFEKGVGVDLLELHSPSMVQLVQLVADGTPIANADVVMKELISGQSTSTKTNSNGEIKMVLTDGFYQILSVNLPGIGSKAVNQTIEVYRGKTNPSPSIIDINAAPKVNTINGVVVYKGQKLANTLVEYNDNTTVTKSFMTNSNGEFSVQIPDGFYRVSGLYNNDLGKVSFTEYQPFYVINGKAVVNWAFVDVFTITLPAPAGQGQIVDNGVPIPNASIEVFKDGTTQSFFFPSNSKGEFLLRLADGAYSIKYVNTYLYRASVLKKFTVQNGVVNEGTITVDVNNPIAGSGNVKGVLKDSQSAIRFADLQFQRLDSFGSAYAQSNARGEFQLDLADGDYKLYEARSPLFDRISLEVLFTVKNGEVYVNNEKKALLEAIIPEVTVNGQVTDGVAPVGVYEVVFRNDNYKYYYMKTDYNGQFQFRLPDGNYSVARITEQKTYKMTDLALNFTVANGKLLLNGVEKEKLDISIAPVALKGQVVDDQGKPVKEGWIKVKYKEGTGSSAYYTYMMIKTDEYGFFSERLPDGDYNIYYVRTESGGWPVINQSFDVVNGKMIIGGSPIDFLPIKLPGITFNGKLLNNGIPVPNNRIEIKVPGQVETYDIYTDSQGSFALKFADGDYIIPRITIGQGYVNLNKTITVKNGTTNPSPIVIDMANPF